MKRRQLLWAAIAAGMVWIVVPGSAISQVQQEPQEQEVAAPVAVQPHRVEAVDSTIPRIRMLASEGLAYLEQLRQEAVAKKASAEDADKPEDEAAAGDGVSRTYNVDGSPAVNWTNEFLFNDATNRYRPIRPVLSMEQRRTAVEAFRQRAVRSKE